jgi:hypothetical protein
MQRKRLRYGQRNDRFVAGSRRGGAAEWRGSESVGRQRLFSFLPTLFPRARFFQRYSSRPVLSRNPRSIECPRARALALELARDISRMAPTFPDASQQSGNGNETNPVDSGSSDR